MSSSAINNKAQPTNTEQLRTDPTSSPASRDQLSDLSAFGSSSVSEIHRESASGQGGLGGSDDHKQGPAIRPRGGCNTVPPEHQPGHQPQHEVQLPTHERPTCSRVGVGSLPGRNDESGVAILPDERGTGDTSLRSATSSAKNTSEMPTTETQSGSSVGIGSMPGSIHEPGVATLPEEREKGRPYGMGRTGFENYSSDKGGSGVSPHQSAAHTAGTQYNHGTADSGDIHQKIRHHVAEGSDHHVTSKWEMPSTEELSGSRMGVGSLPGKHYEQGVALLPEERLHPPDPILMSHLPPRMDELPAEEHPSGSKVGVGSLPGKRGEQRVALAPEERLHPAEDILGSHLPPRMDQLPGEEHPSGSTVGVGSLPGGRNEQGVVLLPEERLHPADEILAPPTDSSPMNFDSDNKTPASGDEAGGGTLDPSAPGGPLQGSKLKRSEEIHQAGQHQFREQKKKSLN